MAPTADDHLVLAHGFTQTSRSWDRVRRLFAHRGLTADAFDLPGHGDAALLRADLWQSADHLVEAGGAATYVGYSMGGRVALHAALRRPDAVQRLVLIGATAGIDDVAERSDRRAADERLAEHVLDVGVAHFVDEWLTLPLFARLTDEQAQRDLRLENTADGLAGSLRLAGTGTQAPLWDRLGDILAPTLLLVGEHDPKFRAIAERMHDALPTSRLEVVEHAGHSVHLEQPERTVEVVADWLGTRPAS